MTLNTGVLTFTHNAKALKITHNASVLNTFCLNSLNHLNKCFLGYYPLISIENNINLLFAPITVHLSNK